MPEVTERTRLALSPPPNALLNGASLFLDFDGTLVEIADRPDAVCVDAALKRLVRVLAERMDGRIALVSGRGVEEVDALFRGVDFPIAGSHGAQLRRAGSMEGPGRPAVLDEVLDRVRAFASSKPGLIVEAKPLGVGLHFRGAPDAEAACRAFVEVLAQATGLTFQEGKMVFELRAAGDKGRAIAALMALSPFAGTRPVFLGDDLTDEPGFELAARMGGAGILVGPARTSNAAYRLPDVAAVRRWLADAAGDVA